LLAGDLEGDRPIEEPVACLEYFAHPALAETLEQQVRPERDARALAGEEPLGLEIGEPASTDALAGQVAGLRKLLPQGANSFLQLLGREKLQVVQGIQQFCDAGLRHEGTGACITKRRTRVSNFLRRGVLAHPAPLGK